MPPTATFVRFVIHARDGGSGRRQGLFQAMQGLEQSGVLSEAERATWDELYGWFRVHLPVPGRLARATKAHAKKVALSWFRAEASEHVGRMREIASILEAHEIGVEMIRTERPGYVVYEDAYQIAAEPFRDTGA